MGKAIGMAEYRTVSSGIKAADLIIKTADVEVIETNVVCPGKYIILIAGEISAVKAAVDSSKNLMSEELVDSFVLGNPHESVLPALYGLSPVGEVDALGVIETYSVSSIIVAADVAAKTAEINMIEIRAAKGMSGKSFAMFTGEVAAVQAAIDSAKHVLAESGSYLDSSVIPRPDKKLWEKIL